MTETAHRKDIDGLRALSVALVVFFHLHLRGSGGGFIGVDVFFVISGYLTTSMVWSDLGEGRFHYLRFVSARAARIWPAMAAMIGVLLFLGAVVLPPFDLAALSDQALWAIASVSNHFFLDRSGYNTQHTDNNWLLHTWSLSVEAQFWLLYPLLLMSLFRLGKQRGAPVGRIRVLGTALSACLVASLAYQGTTLGASAERAFFLLPSRAWELIAGGLIYVFSRDAGIRGPRQRQLAQWASYAGVALIVGSALSFGYVHLQPVGTGYLALVPVAGAALVLSAKGADNVLLDNPLAQRIGELSYSIYLWHWPLIIALRLADAFEPYPRLAEGFVVAASVGLAWLSYRFVERPARFKHSSWTKRAAMTPLVMMGAAGALAAIGATTNGMAFRLRPGAFVPEQPSATEAPYFPARCDNFKKPAATLKVCSVSRGTTRRVLVIGDSHAEHLYPWFEQHTQVTVDFFTVPECPPVPAFERVQSGFHCLDYAAAAWKMAQSASYDTVIVAARWATIAIGGLPYCHEDVAGACVFLNGAGHYASLRTELGAAIERTLAAGKTVVMLRPSPESRLRVPMRIAREQFWFGEVRLSIDRQRVIEQNAWLEPLFTQFAKAPRFRLVSLWDELCEGSICSVFDRERDRPIYVDESHFDPAWMVRHGDIFAPFVERDSAAR